MLLVAGGLALVGAGNQGGVSSLLAPVGTRVEQVAAFGSSSVQASTSAAPSAAQQAAPAQQSGVVDARAVAKQAGPAVVTIVSTMQVQSRRFGGGSRTAQASGTGIIIDSKGDIVTNHHVIANAQSLEVIYADGARVAATVVGQDANGDVAVIKVSGKVPAVAQFGDSSKLEMGQPVVAIGTALGDYANTVTQGVVSGLHRKIPDAGPSAKDMIQTDAAINHGDSGGPLLDLNGNVIGINTAVISVDTTGEVAQGLGFAIPSNTVKSVISRWVK
ncbi:MAG: S1C family serine protease [Chloroflexia bacterium]